MVLQSTVVCAANAFTDFNARSRYDEGEHILPDRGWEQSVLPAREAPRNKRPKATKRTFEMRSAALDNPANPALPATIEMIKRTNAHFSIKASPPNEHRSTCPEALCSGSARPARAGE